MIESLHVGGNFDRAFPGFGDHHQERVMHGAARAREQFEGIVKACRIAAARLDHGLQPLYVLSPRGVIEHRLAHAHPITVAEQRVDLPVVRYHPERLGQRPTG